MNDSRTFFWRMYHSLLPTQKNLNKTCCRVLSPNCVLCDSNLPDDIGNHCFTACSQSLPAMNWLLSIIESMDPTVNLTKLVTLQIEPTNPTHLLECVWIVGVTLEYIWAKRKAKQQINLNDMVSKIRAKCHMFTKSSLYSENAKNLEAKL